MTANDKQNEAVEVTPEAPAQSGSAQVAPEAPTQGESVESTPDNNQQGDPTAQDTKDQSASAPIQAGVSVVSPHFDDEDVPAALERETHDGPGTDDLSDLPAEDFEGFAEGDVETEDDSE